MNSSVDNPSPVASVAVASETEEASVAASVVGASVSVSSVLFPHAQSARESASAILVQAALDGVSEIKIFSIRDQFYERAENIVDQLKNRTKCQVTLDDFSDESKLRTAIAEADILVNGTSVGMSPKVDACVIKDEMFKDSSVFRKELIVSDVIYEPAETKLLRLAKEAGCETFNGMYMLLYQGAQSFKIWTGQDMPTEPIKELYF